MLCGILLLATEQRTGPDSLCQVSFLRDDLEYFDDERGREARASVATQASLGSNPSLLPITWRPNKKDPHKAGLFCLNGVPKGNENKPQGPRQ